MLFELCRFWERQSPASDKGDKSGCWQMLEIHPHPSLGRLSSQITQAIRWPLEGDLNHQSLGVEWKHEAKVLYSSSARIRTHADTCAHVAPSTQKIPKPRSCHPNNSPQLSRGKASQLVHRAESKSNKKISLARSGQAQLPLLGSYDTQAGVSVAGSAPQPAHGVKMSLGCCLTLYPPGSSPDLQEVVVTNAFPNEVVPHLAPRLLVLPQEDHVRLDLLCHALQRGVGCFHVCLAQAVLGPI